MRQEQTNILFVTPYFPPNGGGLERYALAMAKRLRATHGWKVTFVTSGARFGKDEIAAVDGITVHKLAYACKWSNMPFAFLWPFKIRRIIRELRPAVINVHMPVPGIGDIASLVAGKTPVVVTYHGLSMRKGNRWVDPVIWAYEKVLLPLLLRRADRIICSSDAVRNDFLRAYRYKSTTVTPAVDGSVFVPAAGSRKPEPTVLFVGGLGRSEQHKGLQTLIDAFVPVAAEIPAARLLVVGDGDMRSEHEERIRLLGLAGAVRFYGKAEGAALVRAYQESRVFCLPTHNDSFSMVVLEAMSCGLPVVCGKIGSGLVEDGVNGFTCAPGDAPAFAARITRLLKDDALAAAMGAAGRAKIGAAYMWESRAAAYEAFLRGALPEGVPGKTRIAVVVPYFYPKIGGLENYSYELSRRLQRSGDCDVSVITSNHDGAGYRQDVIDGMTVHRLPTAFRVSNTPVNPMWYFWLRKLFRFAKPQLVHAHSPVPFIADVAAMAAGQTPVLVTYHAGSMRKGRYPIDAVIWAYEQYVLRLLFKKARAIVAISTKYFESAFPEFRAKVHDIPPSVDDERFAATPLPSGSKTVLFVGRIEETSSWKGIAALLRAMKLVARSIPDAKLELVGGGDAVPRYRAMAKDLGIERNVIFSGPMLGDELVRAYRRSSALTLPSLTGAEAFGIVLIEAMASGRPVIGSNVGGIPQVIADGEDGLLVTPGDESALAAAIRRVLSDEPFARHLAANGVRKARTKYGMAAQVAQYRALISDCLS